MVSNAGVDKASYAVEGPSLASVFSIRFSGGHDCAPRYLRQILESPKVNPKKQHKIQNADGTQVRTDINPDKNKRTIRGDICLRRVVSKIKELPSALKITQSKATMQASVEWQPLVTIEVVSHEVSSVWNHTVARRHKVDMQAVETDFVSEGWWGCGVAKVRVAFRSPSSMAAAASPQSFSNARALMHHDPVVRSRKLSLLFTEACMHSVFLSPSATVLWKPLKVPSTSGSFGSTGTLTPVDLLTAQIPTAAD